MIVLGLVTTADLAGAAYEATDTALAKPATVILVHGAFAGSSSWNDVISDLGEHGYPVIAVSNHLRGLRSDADYVARIDPFPKAGRRLRTVRLWRRRNCLPA